MSAQQLIPIKAIDSGVVLTDDNRLVMMLKVDAINTELMSNTELKYLFEDYSSFLKSIYFKFQTEIVSQPIDLTNYIKGQQQNLQKTINPYKRKLLESNIDYSRNMEHSKQVIQRQRYFIFDEPVKGKEQSHYEFAMNDLEVKAEHIISGHKEIGLTAEPLNNVEAMRYMHIFFDYEGAQYTPINHSSIQQIITGGIKHEN
jgi:type IV secretory pathway VirB4 component